MIEFNMASGKLNVGGLFSKAIETFRAKLQFFVFTGFLIGIGNLAVSSSGLETGHVNSVGLAVIGVILTTFLGLLGEVVAVRATAGPLGANAGAEFVPALQSALPKVLPLLLTLLLLWIVVFLGLIVLVIPGVILALMLIVSASACILEDRSPVEALKRSRELTRGNHWRLLGLVVLVIVAALGFSLVLAIPVGIASLAPGLGGMVAKVISSAGQGLFTVFVIVILTHAFLDLRHLKEASGPAPLV